MNYPDDGRGMKFTVGWLWLMDTTHQILVIKTLYDICVTRFGNVASLAVIPPDFVAEIIFTVLVSSTTQLFFTYRIWLFSGKKWIFPLLVIPTVITQIAIQAIYMAGLLIDGSLEQLKRQNPSAIAYNAIAAGTDIFLACCMTYLLLAERTSNVSESTNQLIGRLVLFSLNSGIWTALVALSVAITLAAVPLPDLIFPAVYTMLCPLYCNTVLANLNSRKYLKHGRVSSPTGQIPMESIVVRSPQILQSNAISIQVDTSRVTNHDYFPSMSSKDDSNDFKISSEEDVCRAC
jgi:hypothetical protein